MPSAAKLLAGASGVPTDPNFRNVTLLLHGDGSNGAQNNTFIDSSTNNFTITRNGNTTQGSFSPYGSRWSNYFDGTGDYLSVPTNAAFSFGTGDFTIECWLYMTSYGSANQNIIDFRGSTGTGTNIALYLENVGGTGTKQLRAYDGSGDAAATANNFALNTWTHVAITRSSNSFRFFVNGTQVGSTTTVSTNYSNTAGVFIGAYAGNSANFFGYLSDFRVVKGTAVYTAAFTPPITPLTAITNTSLLTCQSNRFRDASTNNFAITANGNASVFPFSPYAPTAPYSAAANGGSMYFDGNADYLTASNNTAFNVGTGDFTVETWVYHTTASGNAMYVELSSGGLALYRSGSKLAFAQADTALITTSASDMPVNQWVHVAATRSGTTLRLWINGVQEASVSDSTNLTSSSMLKIGTSTGNLYMTGYLSNLRIVKGTAVYTAAFTPPTAPVTAITNTSLLLNGTNAAIIDSTADNDLETVGNAQISTSVKKFGTGSIAFDGSGDYLVAPSSTAFDLGSGNFTIECWFNANSFAAAFGLASRYAYSGAGFGWLLQVRSATSIRFLRGNDLFFDSTVSTMSTGTWYHIAVVRNGSTITVYLNGTQVGQATGVSDFTDASSTTLQIGRTHTVTDDLNGYIDDLRITKGVARYTANFTPPTAAFPDQ